MMSKVSISIVLYNNDYLEVNKTLDSVLSANIDIAIYLIDNSEKSTLKAFLPEDKRIRYIKNDFNIGFGSAHNIAIKESFKNDCKYHLVLNPDIEFDTKVLEKIVKYMDTNVDVGNLMPLVKYKDGSIQRLCKLLPRPIDLFIRRFFPFDFIKNKINQRYELHSFSYDKIAIIPSLSGCFMFLRLSTLKNVGIFDEKFFMYFEDVDLNRRIGKISKTVFFPEVSIVHGFKKESANFNKLLYYHLQSAFYYFNKWGWFFDKERAEINLKIIKKLEI